MAAFESAPDEAYLDRNLAVQALARMAIKLGYKVTITLDAKDKEYGIIYIQLPTGQVSWHIPLDELDASLTDQKSLFESIIGDFFNTNVWDGHDVGEKRIRLRKFVEDL